MQNAANITISDKDRFIIFSDLHMGNGSSLDDFHHNADLFSSVIEYYYLSKNYNLILNGDIEELQRFSLFSITRTWKKLYQLFTRFNRKKKLYKLVGNHDDQLQFINYNPCEFPLYEALKLDYYGNILFIFHGHQASIIFERYNYIIKFILRYFSNPLRIRNLSVSQNSKKKFKTEKRVYNFSTRNHIISIIGHTHRPLFESLSKIDSYKFKIEELCRNYPYQNKGEKEKTAQIIDKLKKELIELQIKRKNYRSSIYSSYLIVPSLFNSGCTIGRKGITGIEIVNGEIALVHWFDKKISTKYLHDHFTNAEHLKGTDFYRVILNKAPLDYVFTRIKLLA